MISRQLVPLVEVFLKFFCYFVMWCHHVLGRHWSFPFSGFWKVGTLQMETLRFYTAGNQNILIRIRYNSLGCWACCMKLKKLTQESNAVFQKQGYYFSSKQLLLFSLHNISLKSQRVAQISPQGGRAGVCQNPPSLSANMLWLDPVSVEHNETRLNLVNLN